MYMFTSEREDLVRNIILALLGLLLSSGCVPDLYSSARKTPPVNLTATSVASWCQTGCFNVSYGIADGDKTKIGVFVPPGRSTTFLVPMKPGYAFYFCNERSNNADSYTCSSVPYQESSFRLVFDAGKHIVYYE